MLYWMEIYLTSRKQSVWLDQLDHVNSDFLLSEVGIPHGVGILKLMFFVEIFCNDLPHQLSCDIDA